MKKRAVRKQSRRIHHTTAKQHEAVIVFRRFVIFTACVGLFIFAIALFNRPAFNQAVAGASVTRGLFTQVTVALPNVPGAVAYNLYYKQPSDHAYIHAVSNISATITTYTVSYLKKGSGYQYRVSALNASGA